MYRQRARAQSKKTQTEITPLESINNDISVYEIELEAAEKEDYDVLKAQLERLKRAKERLDKVEWTEHESLERDVDVPETFYGILTKGKGFKLYDFKENRKLAVRVLHPGKAEDITGVDLVYEMYRWTPKGAEVRIIAIQYKRWDKQALYTSKARNLEQQLVDMNHSFCESELCTVVDDQPYRLPACSAFLRLTDIEQTKDGWHLTDGQHLRVCDVKRVAHITTKKHMVLRAEVINDICLGQETFQELFNKGIIGSTWMPVGHLDYWYSQASVIEATDRIVAHVKDVDYNYSDRDNS